MKSPVDLVVTHARMPWKGLGLWCLVVQNGRVLQVAKEFHGQALETWNAEGALLLPGFIDAHVHLNEPGRTSREGLSTGTRALAAGGVTSFFDMPLNSNPPCTTAEAVEAKRALAQKKSHIDFALWGGLVPENSDQLDELFRGGVIGLKAFLCDSGLPEFPASDLRALEKGARACRKASRVLAVHAEDPEVLERHRMQGPGTWKEFVRSRPVEVEMEAVRKLLVVVEKTGVHLHVVHVSSPEVVQLIARARRKKLRVTCETCPHYLLLNERAVESLGGLAKCAPPLRPEKARKHLWEALASGKIHTIGSDHSPAPQGKKTGSDFARLWGGISGAQHGMLLFAEEAIRRKIPWIQVVLRTSRASADCFALRNKGGLVRGADADFVLLEKCEGRQIREEDLFTRHPLSPYIGKTPGWKTAATFVRGKAVFHNGVFSQPSGQEIATV